MKITRRHLLAVSAGFTAATLVAACAPRPVAPEPEAVPEETPEVVVEVPAEPEPVEITYLIRTDIGAKMAEWTEASVKAFEEKYPHIKVTEIGVPWGDYNAKLLTMFAAGTPPEISANYAAGFGTFLINNAIVPLDDFVAVHDIDLTVFSDATIASISRDGKLWGMPLAHMPVVFFYNKDLLDEAGVPTPPTDWSDRTWTVDTVRDVATKVARDTDDPTVGVWGMTFQTGQLGVQSWLWGADPFNDQGGPEYTEAYKTGTLTEAFYTRQEILEFHRWRHSLVWEHRIMPRPADTDLLAQLYGFVMMTGRIGMQNEGAWQFTSFEDVKPDWAWGVAPNPWGPAGVNTAPLFNDSWMLSRGAAEPEAGFQFLKFLGVEEGARLYAEITGFVSAHRDYIPIWFESRMKIPNIAISRQQLEQVILGAFEYGFETPGKTIDRFPEANSAYNHTTAPIWNNEISVEEGLQGVQEAIKRVIEAPR